jgi:hypothetical protein
MERWESFPTFLYSTQGKNPTRTAPDFDFLSSLQSVQNYSFQQPVIRQKLIMSKPLIGRGQVNTHWKDENALYLFGFRLSVRFQIKQQQISTY